MTTFALAKTNSIRSLGNKCLQRVSIESSEDARLVARVKDGDESALEAIYRKYGGAVGFVARRVLRDDALAEDVVQDVFVSFWRSPDRFDNGRGSLRSYLLTIAHRRAVDIVRSEEARSRREDTSPSPDTIDLEDEVWVRSQSEMVRSAVAGLGDDERAAISLAYFGGLTYAEVAKRLDEPEGTVKSRIRSGMKKLSETLSEVAP
jgi:RNA polymerase sigma-70 factor (ECF subfamily)